MKFSKRKKPESEGLISIALGPKTLIPTLIRKSATHYQPERTRKLQSCPGDSLGYAQVLERVFGFWPDQTATQ